MKSAIYLLKVKILLIHLINKPYLQPRLLSEILTISNLRHAASRTSTCAEPELRLCWWRCAIVKTTTPWRLITAFSVSLNVTQFVNCENELTRCLVCLIANIFFSIYWRLRYFQVLLPNCKTYTDVCNIISLLA